MKIIIILFVLSVGNVLAQITPLQKSQYSKITSHSELSQFIKEIDKKIGTKESEGAIIVDLEKYDQSGRC